MNEKKRELILLTSRDICGFLAEKYAVDVDIYEIAEFINLNMRHILNKLED